MVKICGITRREDAEAAVGAGASAIGFVFHPQSPRFVSPQQAADLGRGLEILKVGVFVGDPAVRIEWIVRSARLDVVQIYGNELPNVSRIWRASRPDSPARPFEADEAILLDGPANGITFDWSKAQGFSGKIILAGGLNASNVAEAIRVAKPWGVDASSGLESAPGIKDPEKVRQFVKAAQEAS